MSELDGNGRRLAQLEQRVAALEQFRTVVSAGAGLLGSFLVGVAVLIVVGVIRP